MRAQVVMAALVGSAATGLVAGQGLDRASAAALAQPSGLAQPVRMPTGAPVGPAGGAAPTGPGATGPGAPGRALPGSTPALPGAGLTALQAPAVGVPTSVVPTTAPPTAGLRTVTFTDTSRSRTLVTEIRYPALTGSATGDNPSAPPWPGPHPLIVFAHGFDVSPDTYAGLLQSWARAGYVVAAPVFPFTSSDDKTVDENDIVNQPGDMSFVITSLLAASSAPGAPLSGLVDPARIGVAGQSDGGETAAAVAFDTCCRDPRIRAAVIMAGAELPLGGTYFPPGSPPIMVIQGSQDRVNVAQESERLYADALAPKYFMALPQGTHLSPFVGDGPEVAVVERATTDFFDAELASQPSALARLAADANVAGVATLTSGPG